MFDMPFWPPRPDMGCCPRPRPPCELPPPRPCEEGCYKVMGYDACGNLIICVKRPRPCEVNDCFYPCRRYR